MSAHPDPESPSGAERSGLAHQLLATRAAVDGANLILLVVGADGRLIDANDVALRLLGYRRDQVRFAYYSEVDPGFDADLRAELLARSGQAPGQRQSRVFKARNGMLFPVEASVTALEVDGESLLLVLARDISDHLHAEAGRRIALERREREAHLLAELAVHPGVVSGDVETLAEWLLEGARELLDVNTAGLWLVQDGGTLLTPFRIASDRAADRNRQGVLTSAFPRYFERLAQGEVIAAEDAQSDPRTEELRRGGMRLLGISAMLDAPVLIAGELYGVLCFEHKGRPRAWTPEEQSFARSLAQIAGQAVLTRARQTDLESLRKSEQRLSLAQEAAGLGSWEFTLATRELWWSEHLYALFGVDPKLYPASFDHFIDLVHPDDRERMRHWHREAMGGEGLLETDYRVCRPDGEVRVFRECSIVESDDAGRVLRIIGTALDITDRRRQEERIQELAFFDGLTGLPNRTLLNDRIDRQIQDTVRSGTGFALVMLDLDLFKQVNDSMGHSQGDALLCEVARRLEAGVRAQDTVSRIGGDEFALLLPGMVNPEVVASVVSRLLDGLKPPVILGDMEIPVSASAGISCHPQDGADLETLVRNADTAMYEAKSSGRGAMRFFQPEMNDRAVRRLAVESGLRRALERDEFELFYQPVFNVLDGTLYGAEALLRWRDPERGLVPPGDFLPVAEQSGLILPIGEWVMHAACRQALQWRQSGLTRVPVLVNISAIQLQRGDVAALAADALDDTGLTADGLCLEITESTLMERVDNVIPMLDRLREMGVRLAVDDFGTGYSSLSYLTQLPLHVLKIDRSFIQSADVDHHAGVITRTVIQLARDLGLHVVAEGVETEAQLAWLVDHGCNAYQGFLRAPALPAAEFAERVLQMTGATD